MVAGAISKNRKYVTHHFITEESSEDHDDTHDDENSTNLWKAADETAIQRYLKDENHQFDDTSSPPYETLSTYGNEAISDDDNDDHGGFGLFFTMLHNNDDDDSRTSSPSNGANHIITYKNH